MTYTGIIITQSHDLYTLCLDNDHDRLLTARVAGRLRYRMKEPADFPTVGDRVMLDWEGAADTALITGIKPRRSALGRVGDPAGHRQIIAANLDVLVFCMSLNQNFSISRAERYLAAALAGGVKPLIVLTKADLCPDPQARLTEIASALPQVDVLLNSLPDMPAVRRIQHLLSEGKTLAFAGSSGVGKSTLINAVLGREAMQTSAIREADGRGRHTTTHRELLFPACGGAVIDTPGMRAFALDDADTDSVFAHLAELAGQCRFSNCTHTSEPGCALRRAVSTGEADVRQVDSYIRLRREEAARALRNRRKRT